MISVVGDLPSTRNFQPQNWTQKYFWGPAGTRLILRGVWLVFIVLIALPLASATPAQGVFDAGEAALAGATMTAPAGDLRTTAAAPTLSFHAGSIEAHRFGETRYYEDGTILPSAQLTSRPIDETTTYSNADVTLAPGTGASQLALRVVGQIRGTAEALALRPVSAMTVGSANPSGGTLQCELPKCIETLGAYELASAKGEYAFSGSLQLLAFGPTIQIRDAQGNHALVSGANAPTMTGPVAQQDRAWVTLNARDVRGTLVQDGDATWFVPHPSIEATSLELSRAKGGITLGMRDYRASQEDVTLEGAVALDLTPVEPGASIGNPEVVAPAYAEAFQVHVTGDVAQINLRAVPVYEEVPGGPVGLAALGAAAIAAVAWYAPRLSFHAVGLYSRLRQPELLDNEVRNNIYEIIRQSPGISARAVHRSSHQSWGTVVYHLRQLERHHLVVSRSVGRTRNYYENHGKYRGMEVQLACLQSSRALALAQIVLREPGISQEDLVARSGYPQPTTSYYIRKLKAATLINERREGRYARYHPHADLGRFVEIAERDTTPTVGFGASGVDV